jgi:hypothetical protein
MRVILAPLYPEILLKILSIEGCREFYFIFTISECAPFTRVMLDYTGRLKSLSWNNRLSSWALIALSPAASCDIYASCIPVAHSAIATSLRSSLDPSVLTVLGPMVLSFQLDVGEKQC